MRTEQTLIEIIPLNRPIRLSSTQTVNFISIVVQRTRETILIKILANSATETKSFFFLFFREFLCVKKSTIGYCVTSLLSHKALVVIIRSFILWPFWHMWRALTRPLFSSERELARQNGSEKHRCRTVFLWFACLFSLAFSLTLSLHTWNKITINTIRNWSHSSLREMFWFVIWKVTERVNQPTFIKRILWLMHQLI